MAATEKNSLDLLRLVAATLVLYSHQYALMGQPEPSFFGWTTLGGAGVTIFFFLSGFLVWSSWERDPDWWRFLVRRSLRIFPALWVVILGSVFLLGPFFSSLSSSSYFMSQETWRYLSGLMLVIRPGLPGVFSDNPFPHVVNGSLWTLLVEFLCYFLVLVVGIFSIASKVDRGLLIAVNLLLVVLFASFAPAFTGLRFAVHFEMMAVFWWGVFYAHCQQLSAKAWSIKPFTWLLVAAAFIAFSLLGPRGLERMAMAVSGACLVHLALKISIGSKLTQPLGDLSYGVYIFAFPVQQILVQWGKTRDLGFWVLLTLSLLITSVLAFASWHLLEKKALRFKPRLRTSG